MKLEQVLSENPEELRRQLPIIAKNCSDYLKAVQATDKILWRGSKQTTSVFYRTYPKGDRPSRDTTPPVDEIFRQLVELDHPGYGRIRRSASFAYLSDKRDDVQTFGNPYIMIPENGSEYAIFEGVDDLTIVMKIQIGNAIRRFLEDMRVKITRDHIILLKAFLDDVKMSKRTSDMIEDVIDNVEQGIYNNLDDIDEHNHDDYVRMLMSALKATIPYMFFGLTDQLVSTESPAIDIVVKLIRDRLSIPLVISSDFSQIVRQARGAEILVTGNRGYYMISREALVKLFGRGESTEPEGFATLLLNGDY